MVVFVAVVVSKYPAIVRTTNPVIDVSETVAHNFAVLSLPYFLFQLGTLAWPSQHVFRMDGLRDRRLLRRFLSHRSSIPQMGDSTSHLYLCPRTKQIGRSRVSADGQTMTAHWELAGPDGATITWETTSDRQ
jgi:hypothetical protein